MFEKIGGGNYVVGEKRRFGAPILIIFPPFFGLIGPQISWTNFWQFAWNGWTFSPSFKGQFFRLESPERLSWISNSTKSIMVALKLSQKQNTIMVGADFGQIWLKKKPLKLKVYFIWSDKSYSFKPIREQSWTTGLKIIETAWII